jgi:SH3-like domain-containing protein
MARMHGRVLAAALIALVTAPACALEYRSIGGTAAVLYDAPSAKAKKLYVVNQGYPLEVVVVVEGWVKVRDANGEFTWVESKALTDKRTVMVSQAADEASAIIFQAQQNVILELENVASAGWLRVKHRDGQSGFIKVADVWGV